MQIQRLISCYLIVFCTLFGVNICHAQSGIWTSPEELATIPMSGPGWTEVLKHANGDTSKPDVANQDDSTNLNVMAAAIVYARTGNIEYKTKVVKAIELLVNRGHPGGRTLAWGREVGAYAIAADLVNYRTPAFESWLRNVADVWECSQLGISLRKMFEKRPSNWGAHAFGSLAAIYAYLNDQRALSEIRTYFVQGVEGPNPGLSYGSDVSWHVDTKNLRWINPLGAKKSGIDIDGIIPDDMRRGGPLASPPAATGYMWEGQQGFILAARILERAGMPIWNVGDAAILRAAYALEVTYASQFGSQFGAGPEDKWMFPFIEHAYGVKLGSSNDQVWGGGKNVGFPYVLGTKNTAQPTAIPTRTSTPKPTTPSVPTETSTPTPISTPQNTNVPTSIPTSVPTFIPTEKPPVSKAINLSLSVSNKNGSYYFTALVKDKSGLAVSNISVSLMRNLNGKNSPDRQIRSAITDKNGLAKFKRVQKIRKSDSFFAQHGDYRSASIKP